MRTIMDPCYVDANPTPARIPADSAALDAALAEHGQCERLSARITTAQCRFNRGRGYHVCAGCPGLTKANPTAAPVGGILLQFTGENAEIITKFSAESRRDGHEPADDIATIVDLFLSGKLRLVSPRYIP